MLVLLLFHERRLSHSLYVHTPEERKSVAPEASSFVLSLSVSPSFVNPNRKVLASRARRRPRATSPRLLTTLPPPNHSHTHG